MIVGDKQLKLLIDKISMICDDVVSSIERHVHNRISFFHFHFQTFQYNKISDIGV